MPAGAVTRVQPKPLLPLATFLLFASLAGGQEFKGEAQLRQLFADLFKVQFSGYQFLGVPQARFGVGTMYTKGLGGARGTAVDGRRLFLGDLDTWWEATVTEAERQRLRSAIVVEGPLGFQKVTAPVAKNVKINLAFPLSFLQKLVSANIDINKVNNSSVTVTADTAAQRVIDFGAFFDAVNSGKVRADIAKTIKAGDYLIVNEDLVLYGFQAVVESERQSQIAIGVQITPAAQTKVDVEGAKQSGEKSGSTKDATDKTPDAKASDSKADKNATTDTSAKKETTPAAQKSDASVNASRELKGELRLSATGTPAPMIVGVLISNGIVPPSAGALSSMRLKPASVDPATLNGVINSLDPSLGLPKGVSPRAAR